MIKLLGIAIVAVLTGSAAQASIMSFSGTIAPEGDAAVEFKGTVNDATDTGSVFVHYFLNGGGQPAPIIGNETISGPATFFKADTPFPSDGVELDIKITDDSTFELKETLFGGLTVAFTDPSKNISFVDRAVLSSLTIAAVPLPMSAPLFGLALGSLGAVAFATKRRGPSQRLLRSDVR